VQPTYIRGTRWGGGAAAGAAAADEMVRGVVGQGESEVPYLPGALGTPWSRVLLDKLTSLYS
jgi:hypothetical protein